jgi:hypothetical protein
VIQLHQRRAPDGLNDVLIDFTHSSKTGILSPLNRIATLLSNPTNRWGGRVDLPEPQT